VEWGGTGILRGGVLAGISGRGGGEEEAERKGGREGRGEGTSLVKVEGQEDSSGNGRVRWGEGWGEI